jgi:beta-xylosidase
MAPGSSIRIHPNRELNETTGAVMEKKPVHTKLSTGSGPVETRYRTALGHEAGTSRRDPSDVIRHDGRFYVWYTKVSETEPGYPSGYPGSIWYATSPDGKQKQWTEQGSALESGKNGDWDAHGVSSPNILRWKGCFYLFYTGVPEPFSNEWKEGKTETPSHIGVAVASSPAGPWERIGNNPVLKPSFDQPGKFDSLRVDDPSIVVRNNKVRLYYRSLSRADERIENGEGQVGVATAPKPHGPFNRVGANPLLRTRNVMVWPQSYGAGLMRTIDSSSEFYYAYDGV